MKRLATVVIAALGLALLSPVGPTAAAVGQVSVPVVLSTASSTPVRFVLSFYNREGTILSSVQSLDQPAGTQSFTITGSPGAVGSYYVSVYAYFSNSGIQEQWARTFVGGTHFIEKAVPVTVLTDVTTVTDQLTLVPSTKVTGTVTLDPALPIATNAAEVELYGLDTVDNHYRLVSRVTAESDGVFAWDFIAPGTYFVRAESVDKRAAPVETATFGVSSGSVATVPVSIGEERSYTSSTLAGGDRFETAVDITGQLFPGAGPIGIPVLYIASGTAFPDALGAGPAASFGGGALLPVLPTAIPEVIQGEIERLDPQRIVIVGGTAAVSATVATQLGAWSSDVDRISGADRFETNRALIEDAFGCSSPGCSVDSVFVATGLNYPDALSAGAAAGAAGAPVLLVNGGAPGIDAATADLLDELGPDTIFVLGGEAGVSAGVAADLAGHALWVERLAGVDRFATSALIARLVVGRSDIVYGATGLGFADALVGGPLAAATGSPLLLALRDCAPVIVGDAVIGVDAGRIVYLGGPAVIGDVLRPDAARPC